MKELELFVIIATATARPFANSKKMEMKNQESFSITSAMWQGTEKGSVELKSVDSPKVRDVITRAFRVKWRLAAF